MPGGLTTSDTINYQLNESNINPFLFITTEKEILRLLKDTLFKTLTVLLQTVQTSCLTLLDTVVMLLRPIGETIKQVSTWHIHT